MEIKDYLTEENILRLRRYIAGQLRKPDDDLIVQDIVSTAVYKSLEHQDRFDPQISSARTWVTTIAMNELRLYIRYQRTVGRKYEDVWTEDGKSSAVELVAAPEDDTHVDLSAIVPDVRRLALEYFQQLNNVKRGPTTIFSDEELADIFVQYYQEKYTHQAAHWSDFCESKGIVPASFRTLMVRCKDYIAKNLDIEKYF